MLLSRPGHVPKNILQNFIIEQLLLSLLLKKLLVIYFNIYIDKYRYHIQISIYIVRLSRKWKFPRNDIIRLFK